MASKPGGAAGGGGGNPNQPPLNETPQQKAKREVEEKHKQYQERIRKLLDEKRQKRQVAPHWGVKMQTQNTQHGPVMTGPPKGYPTAAAGMVGGLIRDVQGLTGGRYDPGDPNAGRPTRVPASQLVNDLIKQVGGLTTGGAAGGQPTARGQATARGPIARTPSRREYGQIGGPIGPPPPPWGLGARPRNRAIPALPTTRAVGNPGLAAAAVTAVQGIRPRTNNDWDNMSINDFTVIRNLGHGTYGEVKLAELKPNTGHGIRRRYAVKEIEISRSAHTTELQTRQELLAREKGAGKELAHHNVIKMKWAFQSSALRKTYFVFEFMVNGDLHSRLNQWNGFDENAVRYYMCQLLLALEYLRLNQWIHRDLKPDNCLLDERKHLKIADFGLARKMPPVGHLPGARRRASTRVGTPIYMAPEVHFGTEPLHFALDIWSAGMMLFNMYNHRCACIHNRAQTRRDTTNYIGTRNFIPWRNSPPQEMVDLFDSMTTLHPAQRIGYDDTRLIRNHPFFANWDFDRINNVPPPPFRDLLCTPYDAPLLPGPPVTAPPPLPVGVAPGLLIPTVPARPGSASGSSSGTMVAAGRTSQTTLTGYTFPGNSKSSNSTLTPTKSASGTRQPLPARPAAFPQPKFAPIHPMRPIRHQPSPVPPAAFPQPKFAPIHPMRPIRHQPSPAPPATGAQNFVPGIPINQSSAIIPAPDVIPVPVPVTQPFAPFQQPRFRPIRPKKSRNATPVTSQTRVQTPTPSAATQYHSATTGRPISYSGFAPPSASSPRQSSPRTTPSPTPSSTASQFYSAASTPVRPVLSSHFDPPLASSPRRPSPHITPSSSFTTTAPPGIGVPPVTTTAGAPADPQVTPSGTGLRRTSVRRLIPGGLGTRPGATQSIDTPPYTPGQDPASHAFASRAQGAGTTAAGVSPPLTPSLPDARRTVLTARNWDAVPRATPPLIATPITTTAAPATSTTSATILGCADCANNTIDPAAPVGTSNQCHTCGKWTYLV